jgi:hypothetical protein
MEEMLYQFRFFSLRTAIDAVQIVHISHSFDSLILPSSSPHPYPKKTQEGNPGAPSYLTRLELEHIYQRFSCNRDQSGRTMLATSSG